MLSDQFNARVADKVRAEIARRRISRQTLAELARISLSTLEKALSGHRPFTLATIIRLEEATGLTLRDAEPKAAPPKPAGNGHAPEHLGAYSRSAVHWLEGSYLTLRPSFGDAKAIFAYCTEIAWDDAASQLGFAERERTDMAFSQQGAVSVPNLSGHIYLVTNTAGQYRMAMLSRPNIEGEMYGILTTLRAGKGAHLVPAAVPLALVPLRHIGEVSFGRIAPDHPAFARYHGFVERILAEEYATFLPALAPA